MLSIIIFLHSPHSSLFHSLLSSLFISSLVHFLSFYPPPPIFLSNSDFFPNFFPFLYDFLLPLSPLPLLLSSHTHFSFSTRASLSLVIAQLSSSFLYFLPPSLPSFLRVSSPPSLSLIFSFTSPSVFIFYFLFFFYFLYFLFSLI